LLNLKINELKFRYFTLFFIHLFILVFACISELYAQPKHLKFKKLTIDDGLSSSIVSNIIQDHKGFVWIATPDGLNRYDGFKFIIYKNNPSDPASLPNNVVQTLFEDHNKNLLIGTENGLCSYNREKDCFFNYMSDTSSPLNGIFCTIAKIIEDSMGNLWLATNEGLIYFDRTKNTIVRFTHDPSKPGSLSNDDVKSVMSDKLNRLWVTTRFGLNLYLPDSQTFMHITRVENAGDDLSHTIFSDIAEDNEGNIWFGSTEGIYCLMNNHKGETIELTHYEYDSHDKKSLSINQVTCLFVDDSGNLWIGTENGGLNLFDKVNKGFWHYRIDDYDPQSLNNESIETIYQDRAGNLWIGTYTGGLNIAKNHSDAINKYQRLPGAPFSLSHNSVACFLQDDTSAIWVGTDGGGLNLFNEQTRRFERFNIDNSTLNSNSVLCMLEDSRKRIWLGTWAGGLVRFDRKNKTFTSFTSKNSGIQDNNIFAVVEGFNDDLWLGSLEHGLIHFQIKENKFTSYSPANSDIGNEMIVKIVKYSRGRLLLGTLENFQIFSPADGHFTSFASDIRNENSLSFSRVTDILPENDSCIWIGTPDGLNRFNPVNGSFKRFYEKDGLPDNFIKALVFDNSGILWVTTNGGICRFDTKHDRLKNYNKADGLQSNEFTERSILKAKNGALFMGGTKGFNIVYPQKIVENKIIPEILITDLKIFNESVKPGVKNSPLNKNITETHSLTLSYKQSVLTFEFATMDFSAPEKNKYAYILENFDKEWIYTKNRNEATYTNLSPGNYVFRVKGSNNDGIWNNTGTSISITILPPWWSTWWFRLIVISAVILVFISFYLNRVRQLKNQKILLEKLVEIKTSELSELNVSKDKFFSIIAHDLKNPFNTIIGFSEILTDEIHPLQPEKTKEFATIIHSSAVQTLRLLENLLEWARSQTGKILFKPVPIKLSELFNDEFSILNEMAMEKSIDLRNSFDDNLTISADLNMIKTILRNLITNAIKFTRKNGIVEVKAIIVNNQAEISVADNGIGMTDETMAKLFRLDGNLSTKGTENEKGTGLGLFLCKEFVEKHGGKIWVESEYGKGSVFKFVIPSATANFG